MIIEIAFDLVLLPDDSLTPELLTLETTAHELLSMCFSEPSIRPPSRLQETPTQICRDDTIQPVHQFGPHRDFKNYRPKLAVAIH
jgi:hypothetical protein